MIQHPKQKSPMFLFRHSTLVLAYGCVSAHSHVHIGQHCQLGIRITKASWNPTLFLCLKASQSQEFFQKPQCWNISPGRITATWIMLREVCACSSYTLFCGSLCGHNLLWKPCPLLYFSLRVYSALLPDNLVEWMSPCFISAHHLVWNSCFLIQFEQPWEFGLKQNKKALPLCLMLTFKLERRLLGLNRRCVVSSWKEHFFFLSFFLIENFWLRQRGQESLLKKSEHLMWLFQSKVKKKKKEIQTMYNTSVPIWKPWTGGVRGGNIPHWGSKVIKQCCKPQLWVDLSPH